MTRKKGRFVARFVLHVITVVVATGCGADEPTKPSSQVDPSQAEKFSRFNYRQIHMGVAVEITVFSRNEADARAACLAAFATFAELDDVMSDYRPTSELSRLSARAGTGPVRISPTLFDVLSVSQRFATETDGAFDVTCGPVVGLWRAARKEKKLPTATALATARAAVGFDKLKLNATNRTANLTVPDMKLDLGGIGKGYAADAALRVLSDHGIESALISAGGDVVASAPPPGTTGWTIDGRAGTSESLANGALSTSGDSEQFVELDGVRYSHVVDPRTGMALTNQARAVVRAKTSTDADALSTALTVLDDDAGKRLLSRYPDARATVTRRNP